MIAITLSYGRKLVIHESVVSEWLDDLPEAVEELMMQPLRIGDDCHSSFSPLAFCAPEVIRGAALNEVLRSILTQTTELHYGKHELLPVRKYIERSERLL